MKKLLVVLLSLGLIAAFAMTASAADVKFSGQYYVTGQYENNRTFQDPDNQSLANFWTRTRVQAVFQVAEGLKFTTRIDALEKAWDDKSNSRTENGVRPLQENIEFEQGYVTFNTMAGTFDVGYQDSGTWGTGFGDTPGSHARIKLTKAFGDFSLLAIYQKNNENNLSTNAGQWYADKDADQYFLAGIYKFKAGNAGLLAALTNDARNRTNAGGSRQTIYSLTPYMKGTFGPVYVEAEFQYLFGDARKFDNGGGVDLKKKGYGAYALAKMNFGPAYAGASFGYSSGDTDATDDTDNSGTVSSTAWSPGIIFGDANYTTWSGAKNPGGNTAAGAFANSGATAKQNLIAYNVFGGYNPTPKINLDAQFWYLQADKKPAGYDSKNYGMEFDVTATYKIYDNLSYMVGAGYFWTGDYFKGTNTANKVGNDYVLLNKLTLNF